MILSLVIGTEFVGPSKRILVCVVGYLFSTLGSMSLALLAFLIRKWRILQFVVSAPSSILCFFIIFIPESARWLISRGRLKEADEIIQRVARTNQVEMPESLLEGYKEKNEDKKQEVKVVGSSDPKNPFLYPNMRRGLLCLMWMGFVNSMVNYGLSLNATNFGFNQYLDFFLVVSADIIGILLCYYTVEKWGRVITVCVAMILGGSLCIVTGFLVDGIAKVIVASLGKVGIAASFAVSLFLPIEIFPTPVRTISTGVVGMAVGVGSILSPLLLILSDTWSPLPLVVFGSLSISAGFVALFLPETMGRKLPETMQEGEALCARRRTGGRGSYGSLIDNSHEDEEIT
ncbi:organic cation transporter protein-like isoform X2 [Amphiura filiformis]|uniref:organic cation transporter protein-like isoform X2 n=1 Tax=Amphiura filiformis TaxID=82378 RepID=UPI003B222DD9